MDNFNVKVMSFHNKSFLILYCISVVRQIIASFWYKTNKYFLAYPFSNHCASVYKKPVGHIFWNDVAYLVTLFVTTFPIRFSYIWTANPFFDDMTLGFINYFIPCFPNFFADMFRDILALCYVNRFILGLAVGWGL